MAARHRLPLAQEPGASRAVVVPGLRRGRHRRVDEADRGRVEGEPGPQAEGVGLLGEGDDVLGAVGEVAHHDPRPGVLDLQPDQVAGEEVQVADHHPGPVRHEVGPVGAARIVERRGDDLEVLGAVRVGADEQPVAAMLHPVDQQRRARLHEAQGGVRRPSVEQPDLGGLVVAHGHVEEGAGLRLADMDEVAGIGLRVDGLVLALPRADAVAHHLGGAVVGVHRHVPEARAVRGPDRLAGGRLDPVVEIEAGGDVAHPDRVEFRALGVGAPGEPGVVVGMHRGGDLEERQALTLAVAVDEDRLVRVHARLGHVG